MARSFLPLSGFWGPARYSNTFCPTQGVQSIRSLDDPQFSINLYELYRSAQDPGGFDGVRIPDPGLNLRPPSQ